MVHTVYSRPVIPILLPMIFGIVFGSWVPGFARWTYPVIFVGAGLIFSNIIHRKNDFLSSIILFFALGCLSIQPWVFPRFADNHVIRFAETHPWKIVGVIDAPPVESEHHLNLILRVETIGEQNTAFPVTGKIRVTIRESAFPLWVGDRIRCFGKIRSIRNFNNPGGFDYKQYMAFRGIWATAYISGDSLELLQRNTGSGLGRILDTARKKIYGLTETIGKKDPKGVLTALILGDQNKISPSVRNAFNRAGVGHLLAISGLHIGIVATVAFVFFKRVLSYLNFFLRHAWVRKGAAVLSVCPVVFYGLLAGMSPSTQRAVIMISIFLMSFLLETEQDLMNTLAVAAMLILIIYPPSLFSASFQLSFVSVLSILYGFSRITPLKIWNGNRANKGLISIQNSLLSSFSVTVFATLGTLPLVMFYFNQVSLVGLLANLLIIPLIGFVVVPLGLLSVFLYPVSMQAATGFLQGSAAVLSYALDLIFFFADLPFAAIKTVTPTYFEIACFYLLAWAALNLLPFQSQTPHGPLQQRISRRKLAKLVAVIVLLAGGVDAGYWAYDRFWRKELRMTILDVGQGGACLLELPGGCNLLIDGGGFSDPSAFDVGERLIAPLLWRKKIKTVDTLILSHPNSDHLNGLLYIAEHFHVKTVWTNEDPAPTPTYQKFIEIIHTNKIHTPRYIDLFGNRTLNGVQLNILYPPKDFLDKKCKENWRDYNNNSLVVQVRFGSKTFLFPGDITARAEKELVSMHGDALKSTVLIAPHHGSRASSSALFLEKVRPELVIISSGWKNRFGFPHPSVLKRYTELGCRILRTDDQGAITISTDGRSIKVQPFMDPSGQNTD